MSLPFRQGLIRYVAVQLRVLAGRVAEARCACMFFQNYSNKQGLHKFGVLLVLYPAQISLLFCFPVHIISEMSAKTDFLPGKD